MNDGQMNVIYQNFGYETLTIEEAVEQFLMSWLFWCIFLPLSSSSSMVKAAAGGGSGGEEEWRA